MEARPHLDRVPRFGGVGELSAMPSGEPAAGSWGWFTSLSGEFGEWCG